MAIIKKRAVCVVCVVCVSNALAVLFCPALAHAIDTQELPRNTPVLPKPNYLPGNPEPVFSLPPLALPQPGLGGPDLSARFTMTRAVFLGNSVLGAELAAIVAPQLGQVTSLDELEVLRQKLTQAYVERGYINSGVLLPAQITDGVVVFEVVEGHLTAIRTQGMARLNPQYVVARLMRKPDELFNVEVLRERFQLLLGDPLFERMNARIVPGAEPGAATLDVDVVRAKPWQITAFVNNYRPVSIGSEVLGLNAVVRNLSTLGDVLEAGIKSPLKSGKGNNHTLVWSLPLGFAPGFVNTQLNIGLDQGSSSVIEEPTRVLNIQSSLKSRNAGLSHTLFENLRQSLALGLSAISRESRTTLKGEPFSFTLGEPNGRTKEHLWQAFGAWSSRTENQVLALRATVTQGRNNLEPVPNLPANTNTPAKQFQLWVLQGQYGRQVLENGAQFILRGTLQTSKDHLLSLDALSIGGVNTVRGFRENQLVRDKGGNLNVEFEYPWLRSPSNGLAVTLTPFFDIGQAKNVGETGISLSSCGVATRVQWLGAKLDLVLAKRVHEPAQVKNKASTLQDQGVHVQLSYQY